MLRLEEAGRQEAARERCALGDGDGEDVPFRVEGGRWAGFQGLEVGD